MKRIAAKELVAKLWAASVRGQRVLIGVPDVVVSCEHRLCRVQVDLLEEPGGRLLVLEVNSGVEFSGFQEAMGDRVDVAGRIADHVLTSSTA